MEAWKVSPSGLPPAPVSPRDVVVALNITTERWHLRPFPDNLIAIDGYLTDWNGTLPKNITDTGGDYVYRCGDTFCAVPAAPGGCHDPTCAILVEGVGATSVGPAHSSIVGLTHGLVVLLILVVAAAATAMGCHSSAPRDSDGRAKSRNQANYPSAVMAGRQSSNHLRRPDFRTSSQHHELPMLPPRPLRQPQVPQATALGRDLPMAQYYTRPAAAKETHRIAEVDGGGAAGRPASETEKRREIERVAARLRDMYALDLRAWSMEGVVRHEADRAELLRVRAQAEAVFWEVTDAVGRWREAARDERYWTANERKLIREIQAAVAKHQPGGYHPGSGVDSR